MPGDLGDTVPDFMMEALFAGFSSVQRYSIWGICLCVCVTGPNKMMIRDFWRMVWQQRVCKIVMLTNLVEACKVRISAASPWFATHCEIGLILAGLPLASIYFKGVPGTPRYNFRSAPGSFKVLCLIWKRKQLCSSILLCIWYPLALLQLSCGFSSVRPCHF